MNVKSVQKIILLESKKKLKFIKNNFFNYTKRELTNTKNNMLRTELKQMLITV